MNLKVYEKTRYQNIYRHKKNKNYVIMMSKPVKTSISRIDDQKIFSTEEAIKIRENIVLKKQKAIETLHKEDFDSLWDKYMFWCKTIQKQAYNTLKKKEKIYNKFFKCKIDKPVSKVTREYITKYIDDCDTTNKQKNEIIKMLKSFFNWCLDDERGYILKNPLSKVKNYRTTKNAMKFWTPEQLKIFLDKVQVDTKNDDTKISYKAHLIYTLTILGFSLGDRIGETRAISYNCINKSTKTIELFHSINYDPQSQDFISHTKTYQSERKIDITQKVIDTIEDYKIFSKEKMNYNVKDSDLIFLNYKSNKPYNDSTLRKHFNYYIDKASVPKIRMYDLRHTYAAAMMSEGKKEYLFSKRMGHKNIQTTINVYGHLSKEIRKEVAESTDKYI